MSLTVLVRRATAINRPLACHDRSAHDDPPAATVRSRDHLRREYGDRYEGGITYVDAQIARPLDALGAR
jgi:arylsulfatase A-like enzyme